jgi:hypothetical protein
MFLAPSCSENQKAADFFKPRFLKKKDGPSPMKSATVCWTWVFSPKRWQTLPQILHDGSGASYPLNNAKDIWF